MRSGGYKVLSHSMQLLKQVLAAIFGNVKRENVQLSKKMKIYAR